MSLDAARACLEETAVLKTLENLRKTCDFVIQIGGTLPGERARPLDEFLPDAGRMHDGDVVFVRSNMLDEFFSVAFPRIEARIVLITAGWSGPTPGPYRHHLDDPRIIRWFGQNYDLPSPHAKFEALPIGFMDAYWAPGNQRGLLRAHRELPAALAKPLRAFANFQFNISHPERLDVLDIVRTMPHVEVQRRKLSPERLWARRAEFAFEISPRGSGFDCHRTWEAILHRTIPIVRSSYVDPLYNGFPVAVVDDWRDITPEALALWREQFRGAFTLEMFTRLTLAYWTRRIRSAAAQ